jgi:hypothetical protein
MSGIGLDGIVGAAIYAFFCGKRRGAKKRFPTGAKKKPQESAYPQTREIGLIFADGDLPAIRANLAESGTRAGFASGHMQSK